MSGDVLVGLSEKPKLREETKRRMEITVTLSTLTTEYLDLYMERGVHKANGKHENDADFLPPSHV